MRALWSVIRVEWLSLIRERAAWAVLGLFALAVGYGALGGGLFVQAERRAIEAIALEETARFARLREEVLAIAAGAEVRHVADPRSPLLVGRELGRRAATLPPGPLAPVSIGQRDLLPHTVFVTAQARLADEGDDGGSSPTRRMAGAFDLAFVWVFLLPLVIIALTYDLLAGERERGTLELVLSQPVSLAAFVLGKALQRAGFLVLVVLALGLLGPALGGGRLLAEGGPLRVALYAGLLVAYSVFWFAAAVVVNAWGRTSAGNALSLVGLWLGLVVVVPGLVSVAVDAIHPPPSRVTLVNLAREAASEAESRATAIEGDHGRDAARAGDRTARRAIEVQEDLERRVQPVVEAFGEQLSRQQALVDRLRFVSPAIVLHEGLNEVAGSGVARHRHFAEQVDRFHEEHKRFFFDRIRRGAELGQADYDAMPRFEHREEPASAVAGRVGKGVLGLLLPAAGLLILAVAGLRRPAVLSRGSR
jgi:ABC-2 type transport system permease protein